MLENINLILFAYVNSDAGLTGTRLLGALFAAERLILLVPLSLIALWLTGHAGLRDSAVRATVATGAALAVNGVIGVLWSHPRPFVTGVGHTFLQHAADSSFPSDHATIMFTVALVLLLSRLRATRLIGTLLFGLACMTAWARVFLGVHYPLDMLGALAVALGAALACNAPPLAALCGRLEGTIEAWYRRLLAAPIARGWLRP